MQDGQESDEELQDPQVLQALIDQIGAKEENFTLNLAPKISEILEHFKVIVIGSNQKRVTKRLRLTNHFFRQYFKMVRREIKMAQISEKTLKNFINKEIDINDLIAQSKIDKP